MAEKYKKKREALKNKDSSATALTNSASTGRKKQKKIKGEGNGDNSGNRNRKEEMTEDFDLGDPPNLGKSLVFQKGVQASLLTVCRRFSVPSGDGLSLNKRGLSRPERRRAVPVCAL